ncbi:MAG: hypothetical protein M3Q29_23100, partial [Chloroflexota bacterium]|nr:hypothetical protein [Chloroflexota bacterium]
MPPTSIHSVATLNTQGNTPQPEILSILAQVAQMCAENELHDGARAIAQALPLLSAELGQLGYYRRVMAIPSSKMRDREKIALMDFSGEVRYQRSLGNYGGIRVQIGDWTDQHGRTHKGRHFNTGNSSKALGKSYKRLDELGHVKRYERRDENGHTYIEILPTPLFDNPEAFEPETPQTPEGPRKPKCLKCGCERFKPVAWECKGCGITYDELPYPDDPDNPPPTGPDTPDGGGTPPTDNLSDMGITQWGGVQQDN